VRIDYCVECVCVCVSVSVFVCVCECVCVNVCVCVCYLVYGTGERARCFVVSGVNKGFLLWGRQPVVQGPLRRGSLVTEVRTFVKEDLVFTHKHTYTRTRTRTRTHAHTHTHTLSLTHTHVHVYI
jgi:hypothetical protein